MDFRTKIKQLEKHFQPNFNQISEKIRKMSDEELQIIISQNDAKYPNCTKVMNEVLRSLTDEELGYFRDGKHRLLSPETLRRYRDASAIQN